MDEQDCGGNDDDVEQQHQREPGQRGDDHKHNIHAQVEHICKPFVDQQLDELHVRNQFGQQLSAGHVIVEPQRKRVNFMHQRHLKSRFHGTGPPMIQIVVRPEAHQVDGQGQ